MKVRAGQRLGSWWSGSGQCRVGCGIGGLDRQVLALNLEAYGQLRCDKRLAIVPGATHLFEEPGALTEVSRLASEWFALQFHRRQPQPPASAQAWGAH